MRSLITVSVLLASTVVSAVRHPRNSWRIVGYFNAEDLEQYQETFEFPAVRFTGGL